MAIFGQSLRITNNHIIYGTFRGGLSTRLTLLTPKPQLGEPIKLKLELLNTDNAKPAKFKFTQPARSPLIVLGPDGREMSPLIRDRQPTETDIALDPGKEMTLVNEI